MDILFLLVPLSVVLVLLVIALFAWALHGGQFEDLEREGLRVLDPDPAAPSVAAPTDPSPTPSAPV